MVLSSTVTSASSLRREGLTVLSAYLANFSLPRTFGKLEESYTKFKTMFKGNEKLARYAESTVKPSLLKEDADVTVLDKTKLGELHTMTGFVNHTFLNGLCVEIGRENAMKWPLSLNLVSVSYHGEVVEGNTARKLLKTSDTLLLPQVLGDIDPLTVCVCI